MDKYSWWLVGLLAAILVLLALGRAHAGEIPWGLTVPHGVLVDQSSPHELPTIEVTPCDNEVLVMIFGIHHHRITSTFLKGNKICSEVKEVWK